MREIQLRLQNLEPPTGAMGRPSPGAFAARMRLEREDHAPSQEHYSRTHGQTERQINTTGHMWEVHCIVLFSFERPTLCSV